MILRTLSGLTYLSYGLRALFFPKIRGLVIIPVLINSVVFIGAIGLIFHYVNPYLVHLIQSLPAWLHVFIGILQVALLVSLMIPVYFLFAALGNLIAAPFLGMLSETVAHQEGFITQEPVHWRAFLAMVPRTLWREWQKIRYFLPRFLGLLILSFIPIIHLIAVPLLVLLSAWMMTLQYVDYAADYQGIAFTQMLVIMRANRLHSLIFGGAVLGLMMVPGLNFIMIPAAVIGGTKLWFEVFFPNFQHS